MLDGASKHAFYFTQFNSIQKLYLKMVTQIFPGAIQTCEQNNNCSYIYTKQHRCIRQTQEHTIYTSIQKHIHKHSYLTYTMCIQTCIFTTSFMNKKEQYIVNNKHVEQERG